MRLTTVIKSSDGSARNQIKQRKCVVRAWLLVLWVVTSCCAASTYKVVVNHAPPYRIVQNGTFSGIYIDIVKEAAKESGIELEFVEVPFKRALYYMQTGQADIMLGPNKTAERERYMTYLNTVPFPRENKAFFVSRPESYIYNYNDLHGKTVETQEGAVYFDGFDDDPNIIKRTAKDYKSAMKRVCEGYSDVVIIPEREGDFLNETEGFNLLKSAYLVQGKVSYITISKQTSDEQLALKLTNAMAAIQKRNIPEAVFNRYLGKAEITTLSENRDVNKQNKSN